MLDACLNYLANRINQSLCNSYNFGKNDENLAIVAAPGEVENKSKTTNKLLIFIGNIEKDPYPQANGHQATHNNRQVITSKPLFISLSVVIAANFSGEHYSEGLSLMSYALAFFSQNPLFNKTNSPDLPELIEQINLEQDTLSLESVSQMWGMLGTHYLPSAVYKVRLLVPDSEKILNQAHIVTSPEINVS